MELVLKMKNLWMRLITLLMLLKTGRLKLKKSIINKINQQNLRRLIDHHKITICNPCRRGKKLLVLDIDYTIYDHRSTTENENPTECIRPYLHEFLTSVYAKYDIIIWSARSKKSVETLMLKLGVLGNPNYKITSMLNRSAMMVVRTEKGENVVCKPLGLIWAKFPKFYSSKKTIMLDDLRRNFAMNPWNGLAIKPFKNGQSTDWELVKLAQYLHTIANLHDFSSIDHKNWKSSVRF